MSTIILVPGYDMDGWTLVSQGAPSGAIDTNLEPGQLYQLRLTLPVSSVPGWLTSMMGVGLGTLGLTTAVASVGGTVILTFGSQTSAVSFLRVLRVVLAMAPVLGFAVSSYALYQANLPEQFRGVVKDAIDAIAEQIREEVKTAVSVITPTLTGVAIGGLALGIALLVLR